MNMSTKNVREMSYDELLHEVELKERIRNEIFNRTLLNTFEIKQSLSEIKNSLNDIKNIINRAN